MQEQFGVSFDGTANVTGALTGATTITGTNATMSIQPAESGTSRHLYLYGNNNTGGTGGSVYLGHPSRGGVYLRTGVANTGYRFYKKGTTNIYGAFKFDGLSANRTYTFPNTGGTIAVTGDIPTVPTVGNGTINISAGNGLSASGNNATANQSDDTTRTLAVKLDGTTLAVSSAGLKSICSLGQRYRYAY